MAYILLLKNATLEDPISKMDLNMLQKIWNPPQRPLQINSPGIQHSLSTYMALELAFQEAYECVINSTQHNFPAVGGIPDLLSFKSVEKLIASHTGIEPLWHDMCPDSCVGFTGPFDNLNCYPLCNKSRWNEETLCVSNG
jgi:hypothetical protein